LEEAEMPNDSADGSVDKTYAELLDFHLVRHGTRPTGHPNRDGKLWRYEEFASTARIASRSLRSYRNSVIPPPDIRNRIEDAFFGDNSAYDEWRARLRDAATRGTKAESQPLADWNILLTEFTEGLAEVRLHQPQPGNLPDTFYVEASLRFQKRAQNYLDRTVSIGLKDAFLSFESPKYQAAKRSMIGERAEHPNFRPDVGGVKIIGPCDSSDGCLVGDPLGDEYLAVIEPVGDGSTDEGKEVLTVSLHAGRLAFDVALVGDQGERIGAPDNKLAVLDALIRDGFGRDPLGRVILARAKIQRKPRP
jgi:hypothetical protein